jgi:hypothetical protein
MGFFWPCLPEFLQLFLIGLGLYLNYKDFDSVIGPSRPIGCLGRSRPIIVF